MARKNFKIIKKNVVNNKVQQAVAEIDRLKAIMYLFDCLEFGLKNTSKEDIKGVFERIPKDVKEKLNGYALKIQKNY